MSSEKDFLNLIRNKCLETKSPLWGRDCAPLPKPFDNIYLSTDQFIENVHFNLSYMTFTEVGFKSAVVAISDLAAMGCVPLGLMASVSWPQSHDANMEKIFEGIKNSCVQYGLPWLGGDISRNESLIYIDITVVGKSDYNWKDQKTKPSELIVITGPLGMAKAGFEDLSSGKIDTPFRESFISPQAQMAHGQMIVNHFKPSFMTDISDGLYCEIKELCDFSSLGASVRLETHNQPESLKKWCLKNKKNISEHILSSGEDYELLFTCSKKYADKIMQNKNNFKIIGNLQLKKELGFFLDNKRINIKSDLGWDSFKK